MAIECDESFLKHLKGKGRAFCAGGDIVAIYNMLKQGTIFIFCCCKFIFLFIYFLSIKQGKTKVPNFSSSE